MKRESNQKISKAYELYCQGKNISGIAAELKASPGEVALCAGTPRDWALYAMGVRFSPEYLRSTYRLKEGDFSIEE